MVDVQNDCLGVTVDGSWTRATAHTRITLTPARDARLVSHERSPELVGSPQGEDQLYRFLPRPESVTLEEKAFLSEIAVSEDQSEREQEEQELQEAIDVRG